MPVVLALCAALAWGSSDFVGGVAARKAGRVNALTFGTQLTGLLAFAPFVGFFGGRLTAADFWWALGGGISSGTGIYLLYLGFTKSHTGVVAPTAALAAASSAALFGVVSGEALTAVTTIGMLLGLGAIWLISQHGTSSFLAANTKAGLVFGLAAGAGFALMFIALDQLTPDSGAWGVLPLRFGGVVAMLAFSLVARLPLVPERLVWGLILLAGFVGSAGNLAFIVATRLGNLSIVAVVASLFPAATVTLAYFFMGERLNRLQVTGVVSALLAVALVSTG